VHCKRGRRLFDVSQLAKALDSYQADRLALYWDKATPKQLEFHRSQSPRRIIRAGNQTGKTLAGAAELMAMATGRHPYRETPRAPALIWAVIADLENHGPAVARKIREVEPAQEISPATRYDPARGYLTRGRRAIEFRNGSLIEFRSGKGEITALASASCDALWFDEPPKASHFGESIARVAVRRLPSGDRAPVWMTLTPIGRPCGWLRDLVEGVDGEPPAEHWDQTVITLTPEDCPHRSAESLSQQIASYLPSEVAQRTSGAWVGVTFERLFTGFNDSILFDDDELPDRQWGVGLTWDHGERSHSEVCLLFAYDEAAREVWVIDEHTSQGRTTTAQDAQATLSMLDRHGLSVAAVTRARGDVNSAGKNALISVNRLLEESIAEAVGLPSHAPPFRILGASKPPGSILWGSRVLNLAMLSGRLRVSPRCHSLIEGLRHWKGTKQSGDANLAHAIDSLRYGVADLLDSRARGATRIRVR